MNGAAFISTSICLCLRARFHASVEAPPWHAHERAVFSGERRGGLRRRGSLVEEDEGSMVVYIG